MWTRGSSTWTIRSIRTPRGSGRRSTSASPSTSRICSASTGCPSKALQKYFYHKYGTTLRALIDEYDIDPTDFLDFAARYRPHGYRAEPQPGRGDPEDCRAASSSSPTAPRKHAENVARKIGILDHFEDVFDIAASNFVPKPDRRAYEIFLEKHGVEPSRSAMFEDIAKNLSVPHELGMTTTLIVPKTPRSVPGELRAGSRQDAGNRLHHQRSGGFPARLRVAAEVKPALQSSPDLFRGPRSLHDMRP